MSSEHGGSTARTSDLSKRYLVVCDDCSFESEARGRDQAASAVSRHAARTDHDVVAVEAPRNKPLH